MSKTETDLKIAIDALRTIRRNRTRPGDWEAGVIDKALALIKEPEKFDWSHLQNQPPGLDEQRSSQ